MFEWLDQEPEQRPGETPEAAARRMGFVNAVNKFGLVLSLLPFGLLAIVVAWLAARSLL